METLLKTPQYHAGHHDITPKEYVSASLRWKFQQRPLNSLMPQYRTIQLDTSSAGHALTMKKTRSTQTNFRESDAQTGVYAPDLAHVDQRLIAVDKLSFQNSSLAGTDQEYEYIRLLLAKQEKTKNLPKDTREKYAALKAMEVEEAHFHAKVSNLRVEQKIEMLTQKLEQKAGDRQRSIENRIRIYEEMKSNAMQLTRDKINKRRQKLLCALAEKKQTKPQNAVQSSIVSLYLSLAREDSYNPGEKVVPNAELTYVDDAMQTEPINIVQRAPDIDRLLRPTSSSYIQLSERRWQRQLERVAKLELEKKSLPSESKREKNLRFLTPRKPKEVRPETPELYLDTDPDDINIKTAQRILRGLADLVEMQEGIAKNSDLLHELETRREVGSFHSLENLSKSLVALDEAPKTAASDIQQESIAERFEAIVYAPYIGRSLDFLAKDLVRNRELEKIRAFMHQAQVDRAHREQQELAQRNIELQDRSRMEHIFHEIMETHQETATTLTSDLLSSVVCEYSTEQASKVQLIYEADTESIETIIGQATKFMLAQVEERLAGGSQQTRDQNENVIKQAVVDLLKF